MNDAAINIDLQISSPDPAVDSLGYVPGAHAGKRGDSVFNIFEETPYRSPERVHHLTFSPTLHRCSNFSVSSPTLVIL